MKAHVIGVTRVEGMSNKKGPLKPYDMGKITILQPIEIVAKSDEQTGTRYSKTGYGYEPAEIDMDVAALPSFAGIKFPALLDLEIGQVMQFGKLASVCTGIKAA